MVVDALVVDCFYAEPGHPSVTTQRARRGTCHVFDEHRVVVRSHGHVTFVGPFKQREHRAGGRGLRDFDEFLEPHRGGYATLVSGLDLQCDVPSLVMGSVVADRLAARTDAGNWYPRGQGQNRTAALGTARQLALVVHQCR